MPPRKYTEARKEGNRRWDAANLDRLSLALPKGKKAEIQAAAAQAGESMNQYIAGAIDQRMERQQAAGQSQKPKKAKKPRKDGLFELARKMPDGKTRHFYGKSEADCEAKYRAALEQTAGQKESPAGTE